MYKLLLLSCVLASCVAGLGPHDVPSWMREVLGRGRPGRGCADRRAGWEACAHLNTTVSLAPHPRDCRIFFYCSNIGIGIPLACRRCPSGLHFNPDLLVCDWPSNVNCTAGPPRPRPTPPSTATTPLPTDDTTPLSTGATDVGTADTGYTDTAATSATAPTAARTSDSSDGTTGHVTDTTSTSY